MKGLITSDFLLIRRVAGMNIYILITAVFAGVAAFGNMSSIFFVVFFSYFCTAVMLNVMEMDERAGWARFAVAGFATRRQYVLGKFCSALLLTAGSAALFLVFRLVRDGIEHISFAQDFETVALMLSMMAAANGVLMVLQFPVTFKYGVTRGRMISIAVVVVLAAATGVFSAIAGSGASAADARIPVWIAAMPSAAVLSVLLFAAGAVLWLLSAAVSVKIFEKKEL